MNPVGREADRRFRARRARARARRGLRARRRGKRREDRQRLGALRPEAARRAQQPRGPVAQGRLALQHPRGRLADPQRQGRVQRIGHRLPGFHRCARTLQRQLAHAAAHDSLTGLANRASLLNTMSGADRPPPKAMPSTSSCIVDLDNFKTVNDTGGHAAGDLLLKRVAETIRASDAPGRFRGAAGRRRVRGHPEELRAATGEDHRPRRSARRSAVSASSMTARPTRSAPASA